MTDEDEDNATFNSDYASSSSAAAAAAAEVICFCRRHLMPSALPELSLIRHAANRTLTLIIAWELVGLRCVYLDLALKLSRGRARSPSFTLYSEMLVIIDIQ